MKSVVIAASTNIQATPALPPTTGSPPRSLDDSGHSSSQTSPVALSRTGRPTNAATSAFVHVRHATDPTLVFLVPRKAITSLPSAGGGADTNTTISRADGGEFSVPTTPFTVDRSDETLSAAHPGAAMHLPRLCDAYAVGGLCTAGAACTNVHADTSRAQTLRPHSRSVRMAAAVERLGEPGSLISIAPVNERTATITVDAGQCLKTRAANAARAGRAPSVCAHFVKKGVCDYGAECRFVHPIGLADALLVRSKTMAAVGGSEPQIAPPPPVAVYAASPRVAAQRFRHDPYHGPFVERVDLQGRGHADMSPVADTATSKRFRHEPYGARGWIPAAARC